MGNSSSKNKQASSTAASVRHGSGHGAPSQPTAAQQQSLSDRAATQIHDHRLARGSRPELPFLSLRRESEPSSATPEARRETKQEREARKAEKERYARLKERDRSMREEHVDGGYLVTLGTYTGIEDFSKSIVRQLQIERRLAPFWKGLNDHKDSWTEAQLVAAARGLPIPAADAIPPEMTRTGSQASSIPPRSASNVNSLTVPITSRAQSYDSSASTQDSPATSNFSTSGPTSPTASQSSTAQLFRGRAKTLASLATGNKSQSPDMTPQEMRLPRDPNVNGQPIEAYLYKDASECPICFMYYPPYLNKTRCCDQPICSECFVQIKRPDPHPPEHEQPGQQRPPEEEAETLVSEVASCPFCVTPEFGITYDPPPFRRGLSYAHQSRTNPLTNPSAMSSTSSLSGGTRRRATSLSANSPQVITTDRVRPDWAKKLAEARAHALRRSAAATALHNAAYVLGRDGDGQLRGNLAAFSRRRRALFADSPGASGSGTPRSPGDVIISPYGHIIRAGAREGEDGSGDMYPPRGSSRRNRLDDLDDLMMMEAIRLSLAAEEDRKKREEKDAKKEAKKKAKEDKKEAKQAEKLAKKGGNSVPMYQTGTNDSSSSWAGTSMARSTSNLGLQHSIPEEDTHGKGKAPMQDFAGFNPMLEPTSTLNTEMKDAHSDASTMQQPTTLSNDTTGDAQRHLEESRAFLQPMASAPIPTPSRPVHHLRQMSDASSLASSYNESTPGSFRGDSNVPSRTSSGLDMPGMARESANRSGTPSAGTTGLEPMLNFRSLAAMIGDEDKDARENEHIENADPPSKAEEELKEPSPHGSPRISPASGLEMQRSRGDSGESSASAPPPVYDEGGDQITPAPAGVVHHVDSKDIGSIDVWDHRGAHEATQ